MEVSREAFLSLLTMLFTSPCSLCAVLAGYGQWVDSDKDDVTEVPQAHAKIAKYNSLLPRLARLHFRFKYNLMDGERGARIQSWPGKWQLKPHVEVT